MVEKTQWESTGGGSSPGDRTDDDDDDVVCVRGWVFAGKVSPTFVQLAYKVPVSGSCDHQVNVNSLHHCCMLGKGIGNRWEVFQRVKIAFLYRSTGDAVSPPSLISSDLMFLGGCITAILWRKAQSKVG